MFIVHKNFYFWGMGMRNKSCLLILFALVSFSCNVFAFIIEDEVTIGFEGVAPGQRVLRFDVDNDGENDVTIRTLDPFGFNTMGPGESQLFTDGIGLEGAAGFTPDVRIDFERGAIDAVSASFVTIAPATVVVQAFDRNNDRLAAGVFAGDFFDLASDPLNPTPGNLGETGVSVFPENRFTLDIAGPGVAAYLILDFDGDKIGTSPSEDGDVGDGFGEIRYFIDDLSYRSADEDFLPVGTEPVDPLLPDPFDPNNPEFVFEIHALEDGLGTRFPVFVDPVIAVGYLYTVDPSGPNVTEVLVPNILPNGDGDFIIVVDGVEYVITAGIPFNIFDQTAIVGGVSQFIIKGISTAEALDPADSMAFVTGLTFANAGVFIFTQTPITFDTDASVPEPSILILMSLGVIGIFRKGRKIIV